MAEKPAAARSGRAAPRASKACDQCRSWRLRCDGEQPICTRCRKRDRPCSWSGLDRRRKSSDAAAAAAGGAGGVAEQSRPVTSLNMLADAASSSKLPLKAGSPPNRKRKHTAGHMSPAPPSTSSSDFSMHHDVASSSSASSSVAPLGQTPLMTNPYHAASTWLDQDFDPAVASLLPPHGGDATGIPNVPFPRGLWWERDLFDEHSNLSPSIPGSSTDPSLLNLIDVSQIQPQHLTQEVLDSLTGRSAWIGGMPVQTNAADAITGEDAAQPDAVESPEKPVRLQYFRLMGPTAISSGIKLMSMDLHLTPSAQKALLQSTMPSEVRSDLRRLDWERWKQMTGSGQGVPSEEQVESIPSAEMLFEGEFPRQDILDDLIPLFFERFGDHYPCLQEEGLQTRLKTAAGRAGLSMLVNAMCSLAARFSTHPDIAGGRAKGSIYTFGKVFADRSKQYLATSLSVPSKRTTMAFLLLAWHEFACNMDSAFWNYAGMALRMAVDLGLQHKVRRTATPTMQDACDFIDDSLLFWSAYQMDRNLVMGTGRPTSIKDDEITLPLPELVSHTRTPSPGQASPVFAMLIRHKRIGGKVAETLNAVISAEGSPNMSQRLNALETELIASYEDMPPALRMNASNLKAHQKQGQHHVFVEMHLWFHLLLFVLNRAPIAENRNAVEPSDASSLVRKSVQRCAEIVALDDANDASILTCVPMANQTLFLAACAELDEIALLKHRIEASANDTKDGSSLQKTLNHLLREIIDSYHHFSAALQRMAVYFKGVGWIHGVLTEREKGIRDKDLVEVAVGTDAYVSQQELRLLESLHSNKAGPTELKTQQPVDIKISDIPSLTELTSLFPELE